MSLSTNVDKRRVAKDSWGQAAVRITCIPPVSVAKAAELDEIATTCLNMIEEAISGQIAAQLSGNGKAKADVPVKGQSALPLGPAGGKPVARPKKRS